MRLLLYLPILFVYLFSSVIGTKAIRSFLTLQSLDNLVFWRNIEPPHADSSDRQCQRWLKTRPSSLIYPYGVNTTSCGAQSLLKCLQRPDAADARCGITEISVAFPATGEPDYKQQPLFQLVNILPNLKTIKWPHSRRNHPGHKTLVDWGVISRKPLHQYNNLCHPANLSRNRSWAVAVPHPDYDPPPHLIECNSDSAHLLISRWAYGGQEQLNHLYETLLSCPNIRRLSLDIRPGIHQYYFPINPGDRFPNITELGIWGYDWDYFVRAPASPRNPLTWFDYSPRLHGTAALWKEALNWSRMKKLDIDRPSARFLATFQNELKSLDSLTVRPPIPRWGFCQQSSKSAENQEEKEQRHRDLSLLTSLPPLSSLNVNNLASTLNITAILNTHGPRLKNLAIRHLPPNLPSTHTHPQEYNIAALSKADLALDLDLNLLASSTPLLQTLELDATAPNPRLLSFLSFAPEALPHFNEITVHLAHEESQPFAIKLGTSCLLPPSGAASESSESGTYLRGVEFLSITLTRNDCHRREGEAYGYEWNGEGVPLGWLYKEDVEEEERGERRSNGGGQYFEREAEGKGRDMDEVVKLGGLLDAGELKG